MHDQTKQAENGDINLVNKRLLLYFRVPKSIIKKKSFGQNVIDDDPCQKDKSKSNFLAIRSQVTGDNFSSSRVSEISKQESSP